jgi:hypothetical protein
VSAITAFLQPFYIAFAPPGLYPYDSPGSILVYIMMVGEPLGKPGFSVSRGARLARRSPS